MRAIFSDTLTPRVPSWVSLLLKALAMFHETAAPVGTGAGAGAACCCNGGGAKKDSLWLMNCTPTTPPATKPATRPTKMSKIPFVPPIAAYSFR